VRLGWFQTMSPELPARGTVGRMGGGGDGSGWLLFGVGIIVLGVLIGWYAARASSLDIRRQVEGDDPLEHYDDGYAP